MKWLLTVHVILTGGVELESEHELPRVYACMQAGATLEQSLRTGEEANVIEEIRWTCAFTQIWEGRE